jgi:hypothetical protein
MMFEKVLQFTTLLPLCLHFNRHHKIVIFYNVERSFVISHIARDDFDIIDVVASFGSRGKDVFSLRI